MRSVLLSIAALGLVIFAGYAAQEGGNSTQPQQRRGMTRRGWGTRKSWSAICGRRNRP